MWYLKDVNERVTETKQILPVESEILDRKMWITLIEKMEVAGQENDLGKGSFLDIQSK